MWVVAAVPCAVAVTVAAAAVAVVVVVVVVAVAVVVVVVVVVVVLMLFFSVVPITTPKTLTRTPITNTSKTTKANKHQTQ